MRRAPLLLVALLALACQRAAEEEHGPASRAPAVPGMETVVVKLEPVRDIVGAFGQVAAEGDPAPVRPRPADGWPSSRYAGSRRWVRRSHPARSWRRPAPSRRPPRPPRPAPGRCSQPSARHQIGRRSRPGKRGRSPTSCRVMSGGWRPARPVASLRTPTPRDPSRGKSTPLPGTSIRRRAPRPFGFASGIPTTCSARA